MLLVQTLILEADAPPEDQLLTSAPSGGLMGPEEDRLGLRVGMWVSVDHGAIAAQSIFQSSPPPLLELFHPFPEHVRP